MTVEAKADIEGMVHSGIVDGAVFNQDSADKNIDLGAEVCVEAIIRLTVDGSASIK